VNALPKPKRIFGRDREWQSLSDFVADDRPEATLGIVSGRRRQGKSYLLRSLAEATGGFFFEAVQATEAESLRMLGADLAARLDSPAPFSFATWDDALSALFALATNQPSVVIIDEFPYLVDAVPALPSLLRRALDRHGPSQGSASRVRLLLCGSAMSVMGSLLAGSAPLRGRAGLELVLRPFGYAESARFWDISDPGLAVLVHSIVGGTPAYRRQFVRDDSPTDLAEFDDWVVRAVLNPDRPLMREARYLLAEGSEIRDPALYHSVLAAVANGNGRWGAIASYIGRKSSDIAHPLNVLEDCGLIIKDDDAFRSGRAQYRITEPLIAFYEAIMRPRWGDLEEGLGSQVWSDSQPQFSSAVVGPHFESVCRDFATVCGRELFGRPVGRVAAGALADPAGRGQIEIDVAVLAPAVPGERRSVISLGEAKWGHVMGMRDLARLRRARALLEATGLDTSDAVLACYAGAGFDDELRAAAGRDVLLADLGTIYGDNDAGS
jgi:AAA+ ATPase superfamily predicted ATPase